jgi:hypothetical protein
MYNLFLENVVPTESESLAKMITIGKNQGCDIVSSTFSLLRLRNNNIHLNLFLVATEERSNPNKTKYGFLAGRKKKRRKNTPPFGYLAV